MSMDRRTFLGTLTAATIMGSRLASAAEDRRVSPIGVQLYSVRGAMQKDFAGSLAKVAAIGYREVELAGLFGHSPEDVRKILDQNGLTAISSHVEYKTLSTDLSKQLNIAKTLGQSFIVCPFLDEQYRNEQGLKQVTATFNHIGDESKKAGLQFAYHSHNFEFKTTVGGKFFYDALLEQTNPDLVKMEMDLYWITDAGKDPLPYFDRYPGRFPLVHVKDRTRSGQMTEVGSGAIDWKRIFNESEKAGIQHYIVEHDEPKSPFESIKKSYTYLSNLKY